MRILTILTLSIIMLFALPIITSAQIFSGDLTLSTQAQVDAFNYTEVTGTLTIGYQSGTTFSNINSLQPLSKLTRVRSSLIIRNNNQLQDLHGLENITTTLRLFIDGNIRLTTLQGLENITTLSYLGILKNPSLTSLQGVENLTSVIAFSIIDNAQLQDLQGLDNLTSLNSLYIRDNAQLQNLQGLENLATIGDIVIENNPGLTSLKGLDNLTSTDNLLISVNAQLQNLQGLENLTALTGELGGLIIEGNAGLTSLQGLENLTVVENSLAIISNTSLTSLLGLENLTTILGVYGDGLNVEFNASLTSFQGLENLSEIGASSRITDNASLTSLQGLDNLTSVDGLRISENAQLPNLLGLENLATIIDLAIENNPGLTSLQGLENIQSLENLFIEENPNLNDCCAIATLLSKVTATKTIRGNGINCNSVEIIQDNCGIVNLTLRTQAEVDAFNYTEVTGNLIIGNPEEGAPSTDITSLKPLSILTKVGETLLIRNNHQLQDLQGLENLSSLNELDIDSNDQLKSLQGVDNLTTIEGDISITFNPSLTSLRGLGNFTTLKKSLNIAFNASLTSLKGLENLTTIGGYLIIEGNAGLTSLQELENLSSVNDLLNISENAQLQNLQGLNNVTTIGGTFVIAENPALISLQGLENIASIEGDLSITFNPSLTSLLVLENLTKIGGGVNIEGNAALTSLQGLENIASINALSIRDNAQLQDLQGLENITSIEGNISITSNPSLTSFQGLENLTRAGRNFTIGRNNYITSLQGLGNLSSVRFFTIEDNAQLQNLKGLEKLSSVVILSIYVNDQMQDLEGLENLATVNGLYVRDNAQLQNLQGLENLTSIEGGIGITSNPSLTSLQGLENLTAVRTLGSEFSITNNISLTSLQGLKNLTSIEWEISIASNPSLTSLQGLEKLITIGRELTISNNISLTSLQGLENLQSLRNVVIENNPLLNDCCVIADVLTKATGTKIIRGNSSNCNSQEAIQESCPPVITGFTLVDAATDQDIYDLELTNTPAVINLLETGNQLNIRANTGGTGGSVVFALDGVIVNTENVAPYALAGDEPPGDYGSWTPTLGRHTLTATPYDGKNGKGQAGEALTLEFVVIDQPLAIISFTLVTTDDNQDQYELKEEAYISFKQYDPAKLNIRANTSPESVGSVVFELDGKKFHTENVYPYALGGDNPPGNYHDWTPPLGEHILKATPYTEKNGGGEKGTSLTIRFTVVEEQIPNVQSFTLVNADNDQDIGWLSDGDVIRLGSLPGTDLNIRANTFPKEVGSVVFELDGKKFNTENVYPYALAGDNPPGDYHAWTPSLGSHTLTATPYLMSGGGEAGMPLSISFEVVEDQMAAARAMPATSQKIKPIGDATEELHAEHIWVYPNPSEGMLSIRLPATAQDVSLYLYNAQGNIVMEGKGESEGSVIMDVRHLAAGMYLLKVASDQHTEMYRILLK